MLRVSGANFGQGELESWNEILAIHRTTTIDEAMRKYEVAEDEPNVEICVLCSSLVRFCRVVLRT